MAVFLDPMMNHWHRIGRAGPLWCHMIADTLDELHDLAARVGLKQRWFQAPPVTNFPHYDIGTQRIRALAVRLGAVECDRRTFVRHLQRIRAERAT